MSKRHFLYIDIVRILLILLMVIYHSFCFYSGDWKMPLGAELIPLYSIFSILSYSFFLETFVFISGFLYAIGKKNNVNYLILLKKKFKRLMIT